MGGDIIRFVLNAHFMGALFTAIFVGAAIITVALPLLERNEFKQRMNAVAIERENIRQRERQNMVNGRPRAQLRSTPKTYMKRWVEMLDLRKHAGTDTAKLQLSRAGYRGSSAEYGFLFFRFVMPIVLFVLTTFYVFVVLDLDWTTVNKIGACIAGAFLGFKAPEIFLSNQISKRQASMKRAFPDSLDLMLICVEAGMSVEHSFRRVSMEIVVQSVPLAEELALVTAELSYLPDRRTAYENLAVRTGLEAIKSVCTALVQAEKYGTPVGSALRVLSQESRDQRMNEAEKKAAALPPKLTVPMILFFLPILFAVILTPALVQVNGWK